MASDAHAHPYDLHTLCSTAEAARREQGIPCAASAWNAKEFEWQEAQASACRLSSAAPLALCFGAHPQLPATEGPDAAVCARDYLQHLIAEGRIAAIGEIGLDLFDKRFAATEDLQLSLFADQLDMAIAARLPVVLHLRRADSKIMQFLDRLKKVPAVVCHSWGSSYEQARYLLHAGVPAAFSFGTGIALNHRRAMDAVSRLPADCLLFETDAPYQPLRGPRWNDLHRTYSLHEDVRTLIVQAAALRRAAGSDFSDSDALEALSDQLFGSIYGTT